jgi:dipeptidyl aminopeptidase/acylaminoacyl peptidase
MNRRLLRILIIAVACVVLAFVVATLGYAFTRGGGPHKPRYPGRFAVRDGCGLRHMFFDASDQRMMCLKDVFDTVSVSRHGEKLAWDAKGGNAILVSGLDGQNPVNAPVLPGTNAVPSLSPDAKKVAFLHSPRNDGKYDIWVTSLDKSNAEQETNTRSVSDVVWSPTGDWLAYVQGWSPETNEGQISLVRPNGDDAHTITAGDAPDWSPDGKKLVYVHNGSVWTVDTDGSDAHLLIPNAHSPAWSRDGDLIAFMRAEKCGKNICPEHAYYAFANGTVPRQVGPAYSNERQVVWLPDPFE